MNLKYFVILIFSFCLNFSLSSACLSPAGNAGSIDFNTTKNTFEYCNDTDWVDMKGGGFELLGTNGEIGGTVEAPTSVKAVGNKLYVASSSANNGQAFFSILDITNPSSPVQIGALINSTGLTHSVKHFTISGNYLYLLMSISGSTTVGYIYVVDISNSSSLSIVETIEDPLLKTPERIEIAGNYAYVVSDENFSILNVSDPLNLSIVGNLNDIDFNSLSNMMDLVVFGTYAFFSNYFTNKFFVVDILNPNSPAYVTSLSISNIHEIELNGTGSGIIYDANNLLGAIDISTPTSPSLRGTLSTYNNNSTVNGVSDIFIEGNNLYVASFPSSSGAYDFGYFDISDLDNFVELKNVAIGGAPFQDGFHRIVKDQITDFIYLINSGVDQITIMDATEKFFITPSEIISINDYSIKDFNHGVIKGNYLYVTGEATNFDDELLVFDITAPNSPSFVTKISLGLGQRYCAGIDNDGGNFLYIACDDDLLILDISNPTQPTLLTTFTDPLLNGRNFQVWEGNRIILIGNLIYYTAMDADAFVIIDVSNSSSPTIVGSITGLDGANGLFIDGNYAYVTSYLGDSLSIIDISDPANPLIVGSLTDSTNLDGATDLKVVGNFAYVCAYHNTTSGKVTVIDIANKTAPSYYSSINISAAVGIEIVGNYAYVARGYNPGGVSIIDITNPLTLVSVDNDFNPYIPKDVLTNGNYLYVFGYGGLDVFDISTPNILNFSQNFLYEGTTGALRDLGLSGDENYAYTPAAYGGINIFDISDRKNPSFHSKFTDPTNMTDPYAVWVDGNNLYVADYSQDTILIYDIASPTSPVFSSKFTSPTDLDGACDIEVSGAYLYVLACIADKLLIFDKTNISTLVGSLSDPSLLNVSTASTIYDDELKVEGNYVYLTAADSDSFVIIDVTNKSNPVITGSIVDSTYLNNVGSLTVSGNYAYVHSGFNNFSIINLTDRNAPSFIGHDVIEYSTAFTSNNQMIALSESGFQFFMIDDPFNLSSYGLNAFPLRVSSRKGRVYKTTDDYCVSIGVKASSEIGDVFAVTKLRSDKYPIGPVSRFNEGNYMSGPEDIFIDGNYAYVPMEYQHRITIYDISNPQSPTLVNSVYEVFMKNVRDAHVVGNTLFGLGSDVLGNGGNQITAFDITDKSNIQLLDYYRSFTARGAYKMDIEGNYLYFVSCSLDKLIILDITDPSNLLLVGSLESSSDLNCPRDIEVVGNYAYIVAEYLTDNHFTIVNVSNPAAPVIESSYTDGVNMQSSTRIKVSGDYAYIPDAARDALLIFDITNKTSPQLIGEVVSSVLDGVESIEVVGDNVFLGDPVLDSITVVDVTDRNNPVIKETFSNPLFDGITAIRYDGTNIWTTNSAFSSSLTKENNINSFLYTPTLSSGACTVSSQMHFNATTGVMEFCDGTQWWDMGARGAGSGGCNTPNGIAGAMNYNSTSNTFQFCDGNGWVDIN